MNIPKSVYAQVGGQKPTSKPSYNKAGNGTGNNRGNNPSFGKSTGVDKTATLPDKYVKDITDGYFDSKGALKVSMVYENAMTLADLFKNAGVTNKQIRSFYEQVVKESTDMARGVIIFEAAKVRMVRLIALTADKVNRELLPPVFKNFIEINVNGITDSKDLRAFKEHFEAIICFMPVDR